MRFALICCFVLLIGCTPKPLDITKTNRTVHQLLDITNQTNSKFTIREIDGTKYSIELTRPLRGIGIVFDRPLKDQFILAEMFGEGNFNITHETMFVDSLALHFSSLNEFHTLGISW